MILVEGKMKSTEVVAQLNIFREMEGSKVKPHNDFMKSIRVEFEEEIAEGNISQCFYDTKFNKNLPQYLLTTDQAKQMLMKESKTVRRAMVQYINSLEKEVERLKVPSTYAEALLEAGRLALELEEKERVIEVQTPKVEYHDAVLNPEKLKNVTEIAKDLGMSAVKLNKILNKEGIIYKPRGKNYWLIYSSHDFLITEGYADYKISEHAQQLKWTELGRKWIIELVKEVKERDNK